MKRQALEEVVGKHIHHIEKFAACIPGSFQPDDIHELRVEYKKVRAFLRLLQLEAAAGDLQIPTGLKAVYQAAGKVRDWQLFLATISQTPVYSSLIEINTCWQHRLFDEKEGTVRAIEQVHFKRVWSAIKKELPARLQPDTIKQFVHRKIAAIHIILLAAEQEDDLHTIRKHLKDIIYNVRIVEHDFGIPFPAVAWASEQQISDMAGQLGDFNDRCIAVSLLQGDCSNNMVEQEQAVVADVQKNWLQQKEEQKQLLLQQVQQFHLQHKF